MSSVKRLTRELADIRTLSDGNKDYFFRNIKVDEANLLKWEGLLVCDKEPFTKRGIRVKVDFPAEYPFKPPKINFLTLIYHPNVSEKGEVCLPLILPDNWKPAVKIITVLEGLKNLIEAPECDHALRVELAEEFTRNHSKYMKTAKESFEKIGEKL